MKLNIKKIKHNKRVKEVKRLSWDEYFLKIAHLLSKRSTCLKQQEGAVIVKNKRILTTGYNGAPKNFPHCGRIGCIRTKKGLKGSEKLEICRGLDAVQNAIIQAAVCGISIKDAFLYATFVPSITSVKIIINSGIEKIFIPDREFEPLAKDLLKESKIRLVKIRWAG